MLKNKAQDNCAFFLFNSLAYTYNRCMAEKARKPINPKLENLVKAFTLILIAVISALTVGKVIRTFTFVSIYLFGIAYYLIVLLIFVLGAFRLFTGKKLKISRPTLVIGLILLFLSIFAFACIATVPYEKGFDSLLTQYNTDLGSYYKSTFLNLFDKATYWKHGILGIVIGANLKNKLVVIVIGVVLALLALTLIAMPLIVRLIRKEKKPQPVEEKKEEPEIKPIEPENNEQFDIKPGFESDHTPFINENSGFDRPNISLDESFDRNYSHKDYNEFAPLTFPGTKKEVAPTPTPVIIQPSIDDVEAEPVVEEEAEVNLIETRPAEEKPASQVQINEELVTMQPVFADTESTKPTPVPVPEPPKKRPKIKWVPPSSDMLMVYETDEAKELNETVALQRVEAINQILANFKIGAKCGGFTVGPSITRYNIEYEPNVSVKQIERVVDDIAVRLGGVSARFTPIVFGSPYSGLEIPNATITTVSFKEVFESLPDVKKHPLAVGFGKDISGKVVYADFDEFPHILVAGTTGSGKSIYIHSLIATLIMRVSPDYLRIVLVDPKKVEMTKYRDMPHLLCPIITEAEKAKVMLTKLVAEMEHRYEQFAEFGDSNIKQFNERVKEEGGDNIMPYIIVVLDEYADLVDTCKEISQPVVSIAQKARAAGIHLLISTQRPSTNIITGVIKGNLPTHVALMTAGYVDSNVIIGEGGAEKLLGKGDMLVQSPLVSRQGVTRLQGCYVQNKEIIHIVGYLKEHYETVYDENYLDLVDHSKEAGQSMVASGEVEKEADAAEEARYQSIKEWVFTQEFVSMSKIQRECSVGFNRAGRFFKRLQQEGVVATEVDGTSKGCRVLAHGEYYENDSDNIVASDELIS